MQPCGVVVLSQLGDRLPGLVEGEEQRLVQHLAVEALDVAVLHGLAPHDVVPLEQLFIRPGEDGVRGELCAVVAYDHAVPASPLDEGSEFPRYPVTGTLGVRVGGQALVADVIDHVENPEMPAITSSHGRSRATTEH